MAEGSTKKPAEPKLPGRPRKNPPLPGLETLVVAVESVQTSTWAARSDTLTGLDPICSLQIPNRLLVSWCDERACSGESYISQLNKAIPHQAVVVAERTTLESMLNCRAGGMASKVRATKGRAREKVLGESIHVALCADDIVNPSELLQEVELLSGQVKDITEEMEGKEAEVKALKDEIARLATADQLSNTGRPIEEVGERQRRRKLSQFRSNAEKVLWFSASFGLEIISLTTRTSHSGEVITFSFGDSTTLTQPPSPPVDEGVIMQTLYLLERFGVSDEFYHELT